MNKKLYLVRFDYKDKSKPSFYKFGITSSYDVLDRFKNFGNYDQWNIKVICTAYGPAELVEAKEVELLSKYPKNFYLKEKIKGVTEIVKLTREQVNEAVATIKQLSNEWYKVRKSLTV